MRREGEGREAVRDRLRQRMMRRAGLEVPAGLQQRSLEVGEQTRTFSVASAARQPAPLLVALHGGGGTGQGIAAGTGLATRGPAAGFTTVFPDGVAHVWNDGRDAPRLASRAGVDDPAFIKALVDQLVTEAAVPRTPVFLAGISNGALFAEYLARHAILPIAGIALIAGTGTVTARQAVPVPRQATQVLAFAGTADPLVPYGGGPISLMGRIAGGRGPRPGGRAGRGLAAPAEDVAQDWATANGDPATPTTEQLPPGDGLLVTRLAWRAPGRPPVELYRIDGGGHTWPGGVQYLSERLVGPVARNVDATGLLLEAFGAPDR